MPTKTSLENIILFHLCYSNSFNFYNDDELPRNQIGRCSVQVMKENEQFTVVHSCSPQNLEVGHFTLLFSKGRQRNVPKFKTHTQNDCFCSLNLLFCGTDIAIVMFLSNVQYPTVMKGQPSLTPPTLWSKVQHVKPLHNRASTIKA